jgi:hypothetical protein
MTTSTNIKNYSVAIICTFCLFGRVSQAKNTSYMYMDISCNASNKPSVFIKLRNTNFSDLDLGNNFINNEIPESLFNFNYREVEPDLASKQMWVDVETSIPNRFYANDEQNIERDKSKILQIGESIKFSLNPTLFIDLEKGKYYSLTFSFTFSHFYNLARDKFEIKSNTIYFSADSCSELGLQRSITTMAELNKEHNKRVHP